MRALWLGPLFLPAVASAQSTVFRDGFAALRTAGQLPSIEQRRATGATGFPQNREETDLGGALPDPQQGNQELRFIRNGNIARRGNRTISSGGVEFFFRGYHIFADEVSRVDGTNTYEAKGDVRLFGNDAQVTGDEIIIDFDARTYRGKKARARIKPVLTGGNVQGDLYVRGQFGSGTRQEFTFGDGDLTTCEYPDPHYQLDAGSGRIRPGREARLKQVRIRLFGQTILRLGSLWIPLQDRSYDYLPQVGQSVDEGYYVKNRYGFPIRGSDVGEVRLDEMTKLGTGLGLGYGYRNEALSGFTRAYGITGNANTFTLRNEHNQRLPFGQLRIENDLQKSNYLTAPNSTLLNTRGTFAVNNRAGNSTLFGFNRNSSESGTFSTENQTISLSDQRNFGRSTKTNLQLDLNGSSSSAAGQVSNRETLDVRFRGQRDLKQATVGLDYQRTVPIGTIENFFPGTDRTPVLTLASDSRRLFGGKGPGPLPFTTELSLGEYSDPISKSRITRGSYLFDFRRPSPTKGPWRLDLSGRYRQANYSDDTAQYTLGTGIAAGYRIGRKVDINARYAYLRPYGYSPLAIDRSGITNLITLDGNVEPIRNFRLGAQTGYDIVRLEQRDTPWQQVGVRAEYGLGNTFSIRGLGTYDTFQGQWSNVRIDAQAQRGDFQLAIGTRYDGIRHTFGNVNVFLDGLQIGRTRIGAVLAYNGYLNKFDSQQYNFIYDLHCAEAVFTLSEFTTGFRSGREYRFFIRLKAFPFDSNFGLGRRGQPLGTGTGRDF